LFRLNEQSLNFLCLTPTCYFQAKEVPGRQSPTLPLGDKNHLQTADYPIHFPISKKKIEKSLRNRYVAYIFATNRFRIADLEKIIKMSFEQGIIACFEQSEIFINHKN